MQCCNIACYLACSPHAYHANISSEVHGVNLDTALFKEVLALKTIGAIKNDPSDPDNLIVTDAGKFLGLVMMKAFYSGMDNVRAELRKPLKDIDM